MLSFSEVQTTVSAVFSAYASLAGTVMLFRSMANDMMPESVLSYLKWIIGYFFVAPLSTKITAVIDEHNGYNLVYEAAEIYLRTKVGPNADRFKVSKSSKQKALTVGIEKDMEIVDEFRGINLNWQFVTIDSDNHHDEKRYFELSFDKKFREIVMDDYLPYVLTKAKEIRDSERAIKLFTRDFYYADDDDYNIGGWGGVTFDHSATFDTLAIDPELKKMIIDDLNRFLKRKEFYRRVGKAWKRGYLLYGPPGTGKSSLIAAMANYLQFDIYDLELASLVSNSDLRNLLVTTKNRSILIIEDIDCSIDMQNRDDEDEDEPSEHNSKLTLSGLLNFIDGLWSSCGDERIIIFTTNYKEKLDPALLRPGRMDMHINLSYCSYQSFKILASNYLCISDHRMFAEVEALIEDAKVTPAEVAEELIRSEEAEIALQGVLNLLRRKKDGSEDTKTKQRSAPDQVDNPVSEGNSSDRKVKKTKTSRSLRAIVRDSIKRFSRRKSTKESAEK